MPQNSEFQKGGRGKKAPYETTHARIPAPLKAQISELIDKYQKYVEGGGDADNPPVFKDGQDAAEDAAIGKVIKKIESLEAKINQKEKGYSPNSFSQGIKLLKEIFDLVKPVNK